MDVEKDVGQSEEGEVIEVGTVAKLNGKMTDDTGGAVSMLMKKGTKIDLPVLGVCTAIGSCGALERATSEEATGKGVCGVVRRDDTKG